MFFSLHQISESLKYLEPIHTFFMTSFLVLKKNELPVGQKTKIAISQAETNFLEKYYNPAEFSDFYYRTSRLVSKSIQWVKKKNYASSTLQSTRTKGIIISESFIHQTKTDLWGWQPNYVEILKRKLQRDKSGQIPVFHLAIWLYREKDWPPETSAQDIIDTFLTEFKINEHEKKELFDTSIPDNITLESLFSQNKVTWSELREIIGVPDDIPPETGGTLSLLTLEGVGPAKKLSFELADRVNLITGDNGLGKTFVLEAAWWSLTGNWTSSPAYPREDVKKNEPKITFAISGISGRPEEESSKYKWKGQQWPSPEGRLTIPGLLIYARVDGAFAVWDPASNYSSDLEMESFGSLILTREEVWDGLLEKSAGKTRSIFNGLINDWVDWQNSPQLQPTLHP